MRAVIAVWGHGNLSRGDDMAVELLKKSVKLEDVAILLYSHMLYCEKNYLKAPDVANKADKSEVLLYRREDGNISIKAKE